MGFVCVVSLFYSAFLTRELSGSSWDTIEYGAIMGQILFKARIFKTFLVQFSRLAHVCKSNPFTRYCMCQHHLLTIPKALAATPCGKHSCS